MTPNFSRFDLVFSQTALDRGIDNTPPDYIKQNLLFTAAGLERIRAALDFPMKINSGYRCPALNAAVGGSKNSQHMKGEAADFTCPVFGTPFQVATFLESHIGMLGIDQLIQEGTWVHVSFVHNPRKSVLTFRNGVYLPGLS